MTISSITVKAVAVMSMLLAATSFASSEASARARSDGDLHGCSTGKYKCSYVWTCERFNSAGECLYSTYYIKKGPNDPWGGVSPEG